MTEEEFFNTIKEATGKDIKNGDFGFINGTMAAHPKDNGLQQSEGMFAGFMVWKKDSDGGTSSKHIDTYNVQGGFLPEIISFLNEEDI